MGCSRLPSRRVPQRSAASSRRRWPRSWHCRGSRLGRLSLRCRRLQRPRSLVRRRSGLILGAALAYASTTASQFGNYAESAGETAVKVYDKTLELNAQYDLLPKIKSATDTATTAANNLDKNYGITSK